MHKYGKGILKGDEGWNGCWCPQCWFLFNSPDYNIWDGWRDDLTLQHGDGLVPPINSDKENP
ncbi:hypothetical protein J6590_024429 [Homalodisca vitripennis]|nr:hypothetical protein J6590_024429 [Homalodisca vitripennis]